MKPLNTLWFRAVVVAVLPLFLCCSASFAQRQVGSVHEFDAGEGLGLRGLMVKRPSVSAALTAVSEIADGPVLNVVGVETTQNSGPSNNRIDLVFVGDGFSSSDLPLYRELVARHTEDIFKTSPFHEYRSFFNIHRVDVVSDQTGINLDPGSPSNSIISPALGTAFSCLGNERLLCASEQRVEEAARYAPQADIKVVLAKTGTYGGAGYFGSGITVYSALHPMASEILLHELGHSVALLADEYEVDTESSYFGDELTFPNISILSAGAMLNSKTKWFRWLGHSSFDTLGTIGTFEGADFFAHGKYRPTGDSKMRSLGQPYNAPSREAFVGRFYEYVQPLESALPQAVRIRSGRVLRIAALPPEAGDLKIQWLVNGVVKKRSSVRFRATATRSKRRELVEVRVIDSTSFVKDASLRNSKMTGRKSWVIKPH